MSKEENLRTLEQLNAEMNKESKEVIDAKIVDPAKEMEESLTSFVIGRLNKIQQDAEFTDLVRMHIRQRLPEASFEELLNLLHETSQDNNEATSDIMKLFRNETSGKTLIDNLKDSGVSSKATDIFNSTNDKNALQAVEYLTRLVDSINNNK